METFEDLMISIANYFQYVIHETLSQRKRHRLKSDLRINFFKIP